MGEDDRETIIDSEHIPHNESDQNAQNHTRVEVLEEERPPASMCSLSRQKWIILLCLGFAALNAFLCLSLLAPFYPGEALSRGVTQVTSGWVFSIYAIVSFLMAPIFGKQVPVIGTKFLFTAGAFVVGGSTLLFGFVGQFPRDGKHSRVIFIVFSFLIRITMALGGTAWTTSAFAIAMKEFSEHTSLVMGLLETLAAIGVMVGPAVGGLLYEAGGFELPFVVNGVIVLIFVPLFYVLLDNSQEPHEAGSLLSCLRLPGVVLVCGCVSAVVGLLVSLEPILQIQLMQFDLTPAYVGLVFLLYGGVYAFISPFIGFAVDKLKNLSPFILTGLVVIFVGFLFMGPSPLLGLQNFQALWLIILSLCLVSGFSAVAMVPTYQKLRDTLSEAGFQDSAALHGVLAGLFTSSYALGEAVGPILASWITQELGFPWATTILAIIALAMASILIVEMCLQRRRGSDSKPS